MSGIEVPLTLELRAAVLGEVLPSKAHLQVGDLVGSLTGGGSANWPPMGWAVRYILGDRLAVSAWRLFFEASQSAWMGDELLSYIYGRMHLLSVAAVASMARHLGDDELLADALAWLRIWWSTCLLAEAPNGRIMLPGMRSAGHEPLGGWREWLLALARGDAEGRGRAESWGHDAGLAMPHQWEWATALALEETLRASFEPLAGKSLEQVAAALPPWGFVTPLHIYRTSRGIACWIAENANGNTPPWMASVSIDGVETWAPEKGGSRIRQQFDHADVQRSGQLLLYKSSLYPEQVLLLPAGSDSAFEVVIGGGGAAPAVATTHPEEPTAPPAKPGRPAELAADLRSLRVAKSVQARLRNLAAVVEALKSGEGAAVAAGWPDLGLNPGQAGKGDEIRQGVAGI